MVKTKEKIKNNVFLMPSFWNESVMIKKFNVDFLKYMKQSFKEQRATNLKNTSLLSETCSNYGKMIKKIGL